MARELGVRALPLFWWRSRDSGLGFDPFSEFLEFEISAVLTDWGPTYLEFFS